MQRDVAEFSRNHSKLCPNHAGLVHCLKHIPHGLHHRWCPAAAGGTSPDLLGSPTLINMADHSLTRPLEPHPGHASGLCPCHGKVGTLGQEGNAAKITQVVAGEMEEEKAREQHNPKYTGTQK